MGALRASANHRYQSQGLNPIQPIMPRVVPDDGDQRHWHWGLIDPAGVYHGGGAAGKVRGEGRGCHPSQVLGSASPPGVAPRVSGGGVGGVPGHEARRTVSSRAIGPNDARSLSVRVDGLGGLCSGGFGPCHASSQSAGEKSSDHSAVESGRRGASGGDAMPQQVQAADAAGADCSWLNEDTSDEFAHFLNDIVDSEFSLEGVGSMAAGVFT